MAEPSFFDDLAPERPRHDRLLFFLMPDDAANDRMDALVETLSVTGRPVARPRRHATRAHIGDYASFPPGLIYKACKAAANTDSGRFEVMFDEAVSWQRNLVLRPSDGLPALMSLRETLWLELAKLGIKAQATPQRSPHITLFQDAAPAEPTGIEPVRWTARDFVLMHSFLGKTRHIPLGRWPLR